MAITKIIRNKSFTNIINIFIFTEMEEANQAEFVPLLDFEDDYEILNEYPFTIRRKRDHYEVKECDRGNGYMSLRLNNVTYQKHILIAKQFIHNDDPEHKTKVDHYNHIRNDNHLENLHWCTQTENNRNKSSHLGVQYEFVDEIDDESIEVTDYGKHQFENYYYDQTVDEFYFWNGKQYRKLHINTNKSSGSLYVNMMDTDNKKVNIYFSQFKKLYDLV